ncbi:hypothetical protein BKA64DRAFT_110670 [Cadophora sp. MPI-SDFR-AT-0126]|nr:hypothetical protein BKA64DRAFT_110670 [Leotiomycetes sp. MPI-SDFR-AT-0126]
MSFSQLAKHTGQQWQDLSSGDREQWQSGAAIGKEAYLKNLKLYKETDKHKEYEHYLKDFKSKAASNTVRDPLGETSQDSTSATFAISSTASPNLKLKHSSPSQASFSDVASKHTYQPCDEKLCSSHSTGSTSSESLSRANQSPETPTSRVQYLPSQTSACTPTTPSSSDCSSNTSHTSVYSGSPEIDSGQVKCQLQTFDCSHSEDARRPPGVNVSWTTISSDFAFIDHIMKLYFYWENPNFSTLSAKIFLADFRSGRDVYCSAALVNAILALGCRLSPYTKSPNTTDESVIAGDLFYAEANMLLDEESVPQLTTIQAMSIMSIRDAVCGRQSTSIFYSKESIRLAVDMNNLMEFDSAQAMENQAISAGFWGAFALDQMWSLLTGHLPFCSRDSPYVLTLRMSIGTRAGDLSPPEESFGVCISEAQTCFRKLSLIIHDSFYTLHSRHTNQYTTEVKLLYQKYIEWYSTLSDDLRLGLHFAPSIIFMHIYYHFAVLLLLRPFIGIPAVDTSIPVEDICAQSSDSIAILVACYHRLYNLQRTPTFLPYIILSSGIANIISNSPSPNQLHADVTNLENMRHSHAFAAKALEILIGLDESSKEGG